MNIYAKIGTMPGGFVHVKHKRKLPQIGDKILVKCMNKEHRLKYQECIIDEIKIVMGI